MVYNAFGFWVWVVARRYGPVTYYFVHIHAVVLTWFCYSHVSSALWDFELSNFFFWVRANDVYILLYTFFTIPFTTYVYV
jgi:hypothetical protein